MTITVYDMSYNLLSEMFNVNHENNENALFDIIDNCGLNVYAFLLYRYVHNVVRYILFFCLRTESII